MMKCDLRRLQILEAVYRHGSINGAASEMEISPSAVSHQIRKLSEEVGERLVEKSGRGILLTDVGQRLAESLNNAFAEIERSVNISIGPQSQTVRLAVCSCFGPGWLIERLADFRRQLPEIDLQLRMYTADPQLSDAIADAFVTAYPLERGFWSLPLLDEDLIAVCAPGHGMDEGALITTDIAAELHAADWKAYEGASGTALAQLRNGNILQCSHYILALEMARYGLGTALVPDFLAASALAAGTLKRVGSIRLPTTRRYYLSIKSARQDDPALKSLAAWFDQQARFG